MESADLTAVPAAQAIPPLIWQRIVRDTELASDYRAVALALATYAHEDGTNVRPSRATLADVTGLSEHVVKRAVRRLRALGLLHITHRPKGDGDATHYMLTLPIEGLKRRSTVPHSRTPLRAVKGR